MRFLLLLSLIITGCSNFSRVETKQISKLSIAIGGCNKGCEFSIYEVDSSMTIRHMCVWNCLQEGLYNGTVSMESWDTISSKVNRVLLKNINIENNILDTSLYLNVVLKFKNDQFQISGNLASLPPELSEFLQFTIDEFRRIKFVKSANKEDLNFEIEIPMENYYNLPYD